MIDWDDAYKNGEYIPNAELYLTEWQMRSTSFRERLPVGRCKTGIPYADHKREVFDLFLPETAPKGVVIFIHGGYWQSMDHTLWSHLAAGPLAHGWAVAMPGYRLCPEVSIAEITQSVVHAIAEIGNEIDGDIVICGHSAGGHLAARMACDDIPLPHAHRVRRFVSISGVHDLRPLTKTGLNESLKLNLESAANESPALKTPRASVEFLAWAGEEERPEFLRQNALIANIWYGAFAQTTCVQAKGEHHFNVIDALTEPNSPLTLALIA